MTRFLFDPKFQAACFLLWCLVWAVLALFSVRPSIPDLPFTDDQLHFIAYGSMSFLAIFFCTRGRQLAFWAAATIAAGFLIECAQIYIPTRDFQYSDLYSNVAGAMSGYLLAAFILFILVRPLRRALA